MGLCEDDYPSLQEYRFDMTTHPKPTLSQDPAKGKIILTPRMEFYAQVIAKSAGRFATKKVCEECQLTPAVLRMIRARRDVKLRIEQIQAEALAKTEITIQKRIDRLWELAETNDEANPVAAIREINLMEHVYDSQPIINIGIQIKEVEVRLSGNGS